MAIGCPRIFAPLIALRFGLSTLQAVIFYSTGDPEFNSTPPGGELIGSGWEFQGSWGRFLGTTISPRHFVTAQHVGGSIGDGFLLNGKVYAVTAIFDDPNSDLRICQIDGEFPSYAELYKGADAVGRSGVVFGRGTQRSGEVLVYGASGNQIKGWLWGEQDSRLRWGRNRIESLYFPPDNSETTGVQAPILKPGLLVLRFDAGGDANECHLSAGDSGGGIFIQDAAVWRLAGVNLAVAGPYNTSNLGSGFQAAIYDERNLWTGGEGKWRRTGNAGVPKPGAFFVTSISGSLSWIGSVISESIPGAPPTVESSSELTGDFAYETGAEVDSDARRIALDLPASARFYRLRANGALRIKGIRISGQRLVLDYE